MESKVSEGGLNVTLTIRLLMHGKVRSPRPLCQAPGKQEGCARRQRLLCKPARSRADTAARSKVHFPGNPSRLVATCYPVTEPPHVYVLPTRAPCPIHVRIPTPACPSPSPQAPSQPALHHRSRVLGAAVSPPRARRVSGGLQPGGTPALPLHFTLKVPALPRGSFPDVSSLSVGRS